MTAATAVAAVDLGASGGRVMVGTVGRGELVLHEAHRFGEQPAFESNGNIVFTYNVNVTGCSAADAETAYEASLPNYDRCSCTAEAARPASTAWRPGPFVRPKRSAQDQKVEP